ADVAGCRLVREPGPRGSRLNAAALSAKGQWLLFLSAGTVLETSWVAEAMRFIGETDADPHRRAAIFRPSATGLRTALSEAFAPLALLLRRADTRQHPLLIAK